ncbi:hypothetical protein HM1_1285 [Heliomicrobium modesticaldum Ice1]|uniref:Uncharacterized protein n=1 Tax=Heliobacterium modesticaldum (strain ATCC 51547 / Ice1) TaxID=498761 RepID=B0TGN1_HELMI|nr:hypothetical protein [Heliomicrobium modesticaldum]ABZ83292.1 hypothetical protein HM1_1285 [Heliomicrobium modesticaldum Ice1]
MILRPVCYRTVSPHCGKPAQMRLNCGRVLRGRIQRVTPNGVWFYSSNPGLFFYPFFAISVLALTLPFWAGFGYGYGRGYR